MAYDLLKGQTKRNFARGGPPPRDSWEWVASGYPSAKEHARMHIEGDEVGVTLLWASAKAKLNDTRVAVDLLNQDISSWARAKTPSRESDLFLKAWIRWRDEFYNQYKESMNKWRLFPEVPWSVAKRAEEKLSETMHWRDQFERVSGTKATVPKPGGAPPPADQKPGVNWWMVGGLVALGALGFSYASRKVGEVRSRYGV